MASSQKYKNIRTVLYASTSERPTVNGSMQKVAADCRQIKSSAVTAHAPSALCSSRDEFVQSKTANMNSVLAPVAGDNECSSFAVPTMGTRGERTTAQCSSSRLVDTSSGLENCVPLHSAASAALCQPLPSVTRSNAEINTENPSKCLWRSESTGQRELMPLLQKLKAGTCMPAVKPQNCCYRRNRCAEPQGPLQYQDNGLHRVLASNLHRLYECGSLCDVELLVGNETFRAHRVLLACTSNYFMTMFTRGMRESSMRQIRLEGMNADAVREIIAFCYTGRVCIGEHNVCMLLPVASMLQVQGLIIACTRFLPSQFDPCNIIGIINFADQNGCKCLARRARAYLDENFVDVSMNEEYAQLDVTALLTLVHRDGLFVPDEQQVYHACMRWVMYDEPSRRIYMEAILAAVRCFQLPPAFVRYQLENCPVLARIPRCRDYLQHILDLHSQHRGPSDLFPSSVKQQRTRRESHDAARAAAAANHEACGKITSLGRAWALAAEDVVALTPEMQQSSFSATCSSSKNAGSGDHSNISSAAEHTRHMLKKLSVKPRRPVHVPYVVYLCGGYNEESLNDTMAFQPSSSNDESSGTWIPLAPMTRPRSGCAAAIIHGLMYVVGGRTNTASLHSELREVDIYDPFSDKWSEGPSAIQPRNRPGIGVIDNKMYVLGGCNAIDPNSSENSSAVVVAARNNANYAELTYLSTAECFDPASGLWRHIAPMHHARLGAAVAVTSNRFLYALGGTDGVERHNSVERYDPDRDRWQLLTPMLTRRSGACAVALDGYIYAMGGYDGERQLSSVERFEPSSSSFDHDDADLNSSSSRRNSDNDPDCRHGTWTYVASMPSSRSAFAAVALNGMIYVFGGYDGNEFVTKVERYDPEKNEWSFVSDIPQIGRSGVGAAVWFGSPLFVSGVPPPSAQSSSSSGGGSDGRNSRSSKGDNDDDHVDVDELDGGAGNGSSSHWGSVYTASSSLSNFAQLYSYGGKRPRPLRGSETASSASEYEDALAMPNKLYRRDSPRGKATTLYGSKSNARCDSQSSASTVAMAEGGESSSTLMTPCDDKTACCAKQEQLQTNELSGATVSHAGYVLGETSIAGPSEASASSSFGQKPACKKSCLFSKFQCPKKKAAAAGAAAAAAAAAGTDVEQGASSREATASKNAAGHGHHRHCLGVALINKIKRARAKRQNK